METEPYGHHLQTTLEAIRKRKTRLLNRISDKIEQDIDPEEYLIQL